VLYEYIEGRLVPYVAIMASGSISFTTVILFATRGVSLSWGAYLALVGGVLMVLGVVMEKLEVEIVVEHDRNQ
ncbi:hypothetical protein GWN63_05005, partial [Candidatus Bathyarchaeota archaeon]|nr:hypothetical protein [Desulfobacterales bacterium]NIU81585.1 hypothetical protein [Candidatus Bathyarchaeota archaeon]NIV68230.1 hypothetical protein [Candidatus Bathyarchaeota archaeon]